MTTDTIPAAAFRIVPDCDPCNPREEWDNLGTLTGTSGRHTFADKGHGGYKWTRDETLAHIIRECGGDSSLSDDADETADHLETLAESLAVILPVFRFEHSGVAYSVRPFGCPWDSGQVGYIFVSLAKVAAEYGNTSPETLETVRRVLTSEVETFSAYAAGEVFAVDILDGAGELLDGCGGFYGSNHDTSGLMEYVRGYLPQAKDTDAKE